MKYVFIILLFCSCKTEWTVKSYAPDHVNKELWRVDCENKRGKERTFLIECRPDSAGVKFKY